MHSSVNLFTDGLELLAACCDLYSSLVLCSLYTNAAASWTTVYTASTNSWVSSWAFTLFPLYFEEVKRPYFHQFSSGCKCQSKHVNKLKAGKDNWQCLLDQTTNINFRKNVTLYQAKPSPGESTAIKHSTHTLIKLIKVCFRSSKRHKYVQMEVSLHSWPWIAILEFKFSL